MELTTSGLTSSITNAAKDKDVGGSYSLPTSNASMIRICIMAALVIEGVKPATAANIKTIGIPSKAVKTRRLPVKK